MCDRNLKTPRHCCSSIHSHSEPPLTESYNKSETFVDLNKFRGKCQDRSSLSKYQSEYYKKYNQQEIPVKDSSDVMCEEDGKGDRETNSSSLDLDQLEVKIYGNISQELQTDSSYVASLESNIKLFRTTVRKIFDTFNHSMSDFEQYKERFENILSKSNEETIAEMEEFIKDMFEHITSSDSSLSHFTSKSMQQSSDKDSNIAVKPDSSRGSDTETSFEGFKTTIEAYKNDNYKTDSTSGENSSNDKSKTDAFCINFLNNNRCVQIKLNNRNLLSEINIRDSKQKEDIVEVASAENIKKLQAKRLEVDSITQRSENYFTEKNIPVKISNPKKNIHLNEDFTNDDEDKEDNRSIFYKICNFLCRKLRKNV